MGKNAIRENWTICCAAQNIKTIFYAYFCLDLVASNKLKLHKLEQKADGSYLVYEMQNTTAVFNIGDKF